MNEPITLSKVCNRCGQEKPTTAFTPCVTGRLGVVARCRPCLTAVTKERDDANPAIIARRAARLSPEDRKARREAKARERTAAWIKANPERHKENLRRYQKTDNGRLARRARGSRRRMRQRSAGGSYNRTHIAQQIAAQSGRCYWCQVKIKGFEYEVDHIFAISVGGTNGPENICISCADCNRKKSSKSPLEFAGRLF